MQLRNRLVKADFWTDTQLVTELPTTGRMLYQGLWQLAEDSGCLEADITAYKMILFPMDNISLDKIEDWVQTLIKLEKLVPYEAENKKCFFITNFHKHQSLRNPGKPEIPLPKWIEYIANDQPYKSGGYIIDYNKLPIDKGNGKITVGNVNVSVEKDQSNPSPTNKKEKENKNKKEKENNLRSDSNSSPNPASDNFNNENGKASKDPQEEPMFSEQSKPYLAAAYLRSKILENNKRARVPDKNPRDMEDWALSMDRLNRLGPVGAQESENKGYSWKEIKKIIDWSQDDEFWSSNILSAGKLREKIVKLENQMQRASPKNKKVSKIHQKRESMEDLYKRGYQ